MHSTTRSPTSSRKRSGVFLVAGLGAVLGPAAIGQLVIPEWALPAPYGDENPDVLVLTGGDVTINGDVARFQERSGLPDHGAFGISELSVFREYGDDFDRIMKLDFRGIAGAREGELDFSYTKLESWKISLFADIHRRYFDPENGAAVGEFDDLNLRPEALELEFGTIRFEAEKSFESLPTLRVRYTRRWRDGERDSTVWGQVRGSRTGASTRETQESTDIVEIEAEQRTESRHWRLTGRYSETESEQTLHALNRSGVNPDEPIEQATTTNTRSTGANGFVSQKFFEDLTISIGGMVTELDANVSGYRMVSNGSAFADLDGDSTLHQFVLNGNVAYRWNEFIDSVLAIGIRGEDLESETAKDGGSGPNLVNSEDERDYTDLAFETRIRTNQALGFYALAKNSRGDSVLSESGDRISRRTDSEETSQRIAAGFRYHPGSLPVSLHGEVYKERHSTEFVHERLDSFPMLYPGLISDLETKTDDLNLRLTVKPFKQLYLVSRGDWRHRTFSPRFTIDDSSGETDVDEFTFSQNIALTPHPAWHVQVGMSWTDNLHRTPLSKGNDLFASLVPESRNDHWSLHAGVYASLSETTDIQFTYTYFRTNTLDPISDEVVVLAAPEEEHRLNAVLTKQLSENVRLRIRYGYFKGHDIGDTEINGYEAHLLYSSLHFRF